MRVPPAKHRYVRSFVTLTRAMTVADSVRPTTRQLPRVVSAITTVVPEPAPTIHFTSSVRPGSAAINCTVKLVGGAMAGALGEGTAVGAGLGPGADAAAVGVDGDVGVMRAGAASSVDEVRPVAAGTGRGDGATAGVFGALAVIVFGVAGTDVVTEDICFTAAGSVLGVVTVGAGFSGAGAISIGGLAAGGASVDGPVGIGKFSGIGWVIGVIVGAVSAAGDLPWADHHQPIAITDTAASTKAADIATRSMGIGERRGGSFASTGATNARGAGPVSAPEATGAPSGS